MSRDAARAKLLTVVLTGVDRSFMRGLGSLCGSATACSRADSRCVCLAGGGGERELRAGEGRGIER